MIHIRCKNCGWSLPFSSRENEDTVKDRGFSDIKCPNCGKILVEQR